MDENERQEPTEQPVPTNECQDCGQPFKTAQGLAGHRRLKHSTSTRAELDERKRSLEKREAEAARAAEALKRREAEIARRQRELAAAKAVPKAERLRKAAEEEIAALPEVTEETILRCNGSDYRIEDGRLVHLYWPKGEKTEVEEGEWFQFEGRAYCIESGELRGVSDESILAEVLDGEG
jgi:actin-related protein